MYTFELLPAITDLQGYSVVPFPSGSPTLATYLPLILTDFDVANALRLCPTEGSRPALVPTVQCRLVVFCPLFSVIF